ncbi:hypothetical protein NSERUTF1_5338 [Nocardia seriolae]|nr:hypothetical protein NSERUTF1_5338 [Nocardia seriolae]
MPIGHPRVLLGHPGLSLRNELTTPHGARAHRVPEQRTHGIRRQIDRAVLIPVVLEAETIRSRPESGISQQRPTSVVSR